MKAAAALLFLVPVLIAAPAAMAQDTCSLFITGRISGAAGPVAFASVAIHGTATGAVADEAGHFELTRLCSRPYRLAVSAVGYVTLDTVLHPGRDAVTLRLAVAAVPLADVTVLGQAPGATTQPTQDVSGTSLDAARGLPLGEALKDAAGVSSVNTGATVSKPVIQGMHSNRILILNNGVRQEGQQWSLDFAPEIDPFVASRITVIQGAASVRYGSDAMGGVILVEAPDLRYRPGFEGELTLAGFDNNRQGVLSGSAGGSFRLLRHIGWRLQGTLNRAGTERTPGYFLSNTAMRENNFSYAAGYRRNKIGIEVYYSQYNAEIGVYRGSHIHSLRDLAKVFQGQVPDTAKFTYGIFRPSQSAAHELFKATAFYAPGEKHRATVTFSRQFNRREEFDVWHGYQILDESLAPQLSYKLTAYLADAVYERKHGGNFRITAGTSAGTIRNTITNAYYLPKHSDDNLGIFIIESWHKGRWMAELGGRYDYEENRIQPRFEGDTLPQRLSYNNLAVNAGGSALVSGKLKAKLNLGTAWRPPGVSELFINGISHGEASFVKGNSLLRPEQVHSATGSVAYKGNRLDIYAGGFYNIFDGYIFRSPRSAPTLTIRGIFPTLAYVQADAVIRGMDYNAGFRIAKSITAGLRGSIVRGHNLEADDHLALMPPDRHGYFIKLHFIEDKTPADEFYVIVRNEHFLEQRRVPDNTEPVPPPGPYTLAGIEAGLRIHLKNQPLIIGIGVTNLYNVTYRSYLNRMRYYADERGRNVAVRIKVPFSIVRPETSHQHP